MTTGTYTATAPSNWVDLDGPVHYVDHGGPAGAPLTVLVHGLGGSHANWAPFAADLSRDHRVLAVDLPGFGLSPGRPRPVTVGANRRVLTRFLAEVADEPVVLAGNSMGGLISALHAARKPETVDKLILFDPALPIGFSRPDPLVISTFAAFAVPAPIARRLNRRPVTETDVTAKILQLTVADPASIPAEVLEQHVALGRARTAIPGADADLVLAARSLAPFLTNHRRYAAMLQRLSMPVLLVHGTKDRLMPIRAARRAARANPGWTFVEAEGLGHVPFLENPAWAADVTRRFTL